MVNVSEMMESIKSIIYKAFEPYIIPAIIGIIIMGVLCVLNVIIKRKMIKLQKKKIEQQ